MKAKARCVAALVGLPMLLSQTLWARDGVVDPFGPGLATIPYILPMEVRLGEYYLRAPVLSPTTPTVGAPGQTAALQVQREGLTFEMYTRKAQDDNLARVSWIPALQNNDSRQKSLLSLTWKNRDSFWTVDLRQDFSRHAGPADDLMVGTGLSYGRTIFSSVSLLFGMKTTGTLDPARSAMGQVVVDYGKVFFTPGLQLRSKSVIIETFLEMPVYAYDIRNHAPDVVNPHDVRANIGIRYNR